MKTIIKTSLLAIALLIGISANAQDKPLTFGVKAGMNLSNFSGDGADGSDAKIGFNVGFTVDYALTQDLYLMTGLDFTIKGAKDKGEFYEEIEGIDVEIDGEVKANPMYLQLPVHVGYKMNIAENTKIVIHAGPYIAYGLGGKMKISGKASAGGVSVPIDDIKTDFFGDDAYDRFDFGLGMGVGVEFGKIGAGLGYDLGLTNISGDSDYKVRNMNAYLTVGYKF